MDATTPEDAKSDLSEIADRVEARESLAITRRGTLVARFTSVRMPRKTIDASALLSLTAAMGPQAQDAGGIVLPMRDGDRY